MLATEKFRFPTRTWPRRCARPGPWDGARRLVERDRLAAAWPELGPFEAERFDPRDWHPALDNPAFVRQTARDRYWGAKRVISVGAGELRAAISAGQYRPAAA